MTATPPTDLPSAGAAARPVRTLFRRGLDAILPPRCLACGEPVAGDGALCAGCWSGLTLLGDPSCACCGYPFEYAVADETLCGACHARPPAFSRARAAMVYDDASRGLLLAFKHADRTDAAPAFGRMLVRAGSEYWAKADLIAPVPLHRWRLFRRRYNQAALLAHAVGRATGLPVVPDLLERRRATPSQGRLSRLGRMRNVRGAFAVRPEWRDRLSGRSVVLIDDVLTTGATVEECARVLDRMGATVDVLTLARVVRPQ